MGTPICSASGTDLSGTVGVIYWGLVVSTLLLGVSLVQAFIFFTTSQDRPAFKLYVLLLVILDTTSSCLVWQLLFDFVILHFGNVEFTFSLPVTWPIEFAVTTMVVFLSQLFYAHQIFRLKTFSRWRVVPAIAVALFSSLACIANLLSLIWVVDAHSAITLIDERALEISSAIGNGLAAAGDLLASATLCLFLASQYPGLERRGRRLIVRLVLFTVNRGVLFCAMQIGRMVTFLVAPQSNYWIAFHFCLSKVHVNTLLAQLNARGVLLDQPLEVSNVEFHISGVGVGVDAGGLVSDAARSGDRGFDLEHGRGRSLSKVSALALGPSQPGSISKSMYSIDPNFLLARTRRPSTESSTDDSRSPTDVGRGIGVSIGGATAVPVMLDEEMLQLRNMAILPRPRSADSYLRRR